MDGRNAKKDMRREKEERLDVLRHMIIIITIIITIDNRRATTRNFNNR